MFHSVPIRDRHSRSRLARADSVRIPARQSSRQRSTVRLRAQAGSSARTTRIDAATMISASRRGSAMGRFAALSLAVFCTAVSFNTPSPAESGPAPPGSDWEGYNNPSRATLLLARQINVAECGQASSRCVAYRWRHGARFSRGLSLLATRCSYDAHRYLCARPVTCRIKWQHTYRRAATPGLSVNRGVAYLSRPRVSWHGRRPSVGTGCRNGP